MANDGVPTEKNGNEARAIRTYQSDVEELLSHEGGSLTKIAAIENEKRAPPVPFDGPEGPDLRETVLVISAVLIILGILTVGFIYYWEKGASSTKVTLPNNPDIIVPDSVVDIDISGLTRDSLIAALNKDRIQTTATLGNVVEFRLVQGQGDAAPAITATDFLTALNASAPSALTRSLQSGFVFGINAQNINQPFLILKTDYYQNAFAGMLAWENTGLADDLGPLFFSANPATETASTTGSGQATFGDAVFNNRDARVLKDGSGNIILLYSFPDKNTLVITTNPDTLNAVAAKIVAGQLVR